MSPARRLIVNADDFGRSHPINEAVIRAHREGILTTASLMVNEPGFEEAVARANENPRLGVGLHLTLICGQAACLPGEIPGLVDNQRRFSNQPVGVGFRYFFLPSLRAQLAREINAQFDKFHATGLKLDHVNGHLHLHLHPVVFGILTGPAPDFGITHMRLTRDLFWLNARLTGGQWFYRIAHAIIHGLLAAWARPKLRRRNVRHTGAVFGLLQNARVTEDFIANLIPSLPAGDSELYCHPALDQSRHELELDALVSPRVRNQIGRFGIELIRYQDL